MRGNIVTDSIDFKMIIKIILMQHYGNTFYSFDKMDTFIGRYMLLKLNQEETYYLNSLY